MLFYQYIQTLYEHIPFCKTQHEFTEEFLCRAFNLDSRKAPSISSCKRYFAGDKQEKEGEEIRIDTIGPFAAKHIKTLDCNELDKYLSNIIHKSKAESELRAAFQNDYAQLPPDVDNNGADEQIKDDNGVYISKDVIQLAKQTRRLFVVVINEAICSYMRKKKGDSSSSQEESASTQAEEAKQLSGSGVKTGSVKLLETDRTEIAGIIDRLTKILDRIFAISNTADLCQQNHSTELVDFLSNASKEQFKTYNESHVLQFHMCDYDTWKANRTKSKPSEIKDIPNTAKEVEDDDLIDQVFGCSGKVIDEDMPAWLKEIGKNLEELMGENQKLSRFCTRYPQYDVLNKLYQKAFTLSPKMFCIDCANDIEKPYSKDVNEYIELLEACSQSIVLDNPFAQSIP